MIECFLLIHNVLYRRFPIEITLKLVRLTMGVCVLLEIKFWTIPQSLEIKFYFHN